MTGLPHRKCLLKGGLVGLSLCTLVSGTCAPSHSDVLGDCCQYHPQLASRPPPPAVHTRGLGPVPQSWSPKPCSPFLTGPKPCSPFLTELSEFRETVSFSSALPQHFLFSIISHGGNSMLAYIARVHSLKHLLSMPYSIFVHMFHNLWSKFLEVELQSQRVCTFNIVVDIGRWSSTKAVQMYVPLNRI